MKHVGAARRSSLQVLALAVALVGPGCGGDDGGAATPTFNFAWDMVGIVGTGQSLSVGALGTPVIANTQPYHNLKLSFGGATVAPPFDPSIASLELVPLTEPLRPTATSYPSAYPANLNGETPHAAMANQLTAMAMAQATHDHVSVHTVVGESGQAMTVIKKNPTNLPAEGTSGRAYDATLFEVAAIKRLADTMSKSYGIGAIVLTHGETDAGNTNYANDVYQLLTDYNTDLAALTGQTAKIPMLVSQQNSVPANNGMVSISALQVLKASIDHPGEVVCTGPKYQYSYMTDPDHVHLAAKEYERLGEKIAQVYFERVVLGHDWKPLQPTSAERDASSVTVHFHVPVPPLAWDDLLPPPHDLMIPQWKMGRGFEVLVAGTRQMITGVEIIGDTVKISCQGDLNAGEVVVGYAATAEGGTLPAAQPARWGHLRDSDPFKGTVTMTDQPNYCVAFQMTIP